MEFTPLPQNFQTTQHCTTLNSAVEKYSMENNFNDNFIINYTIIIT